MKPQYILVFTLWLVLSRHGCALTTGEREKVASIKQLAGQQAVELAEAQQVNGSVITHLTDAQAQLEAAQAETSKLQTGIDAMREWGVAQQERADKAETALGKMTAARNFWRRIVLLAAGGLGLFLLVRFGLPLIAKAAI